MQLQGLRPPPPTPNVNWLTFSSQVDLMMCSLTIITNTSKQSSQIFPTKSEKKLDTRWYCVMHGMNCLYWAISKPWVSHPPPIYTMYTNNPCDTHLIQTETRRQDMRLHQTKWDVTLLVFSRCCSFVSYSLCPCTKEHNEENKDLIELLVSSSNLSLGNLIFSNIGANNFLFREFGLYFVSQFLILYKRVYKSRYLSLNMIPHRQLVLYTVNASREEIIPKESWFFNRRMKPVVSDNIWIDEYLIAPLIYHWYTNPFLC